MKKRRLTPVEAHRRKQAARGLVRVEVQVLEADVSLLREVAATLRSGERRAAEVRSLLRRSLRPKQGILELLALDLATDLPDDVLDAVLVRSKDRARRVSL